MGLPADRDFYVETIAVEQGQSMARSHIHDYYEISYLLVGQRRFLINHTLYDLLPHDVMLVNKDDVHVAQAEKENQRYSRHLVTFNDNFLNSLGTAFDKSLLMRVFENKKVHISEIFQSQINNLVNKALEKIDLRDELSQYTAKLAVIELLVTLNQCATSRVTPLLESITVYEERIQEVCKYMFNYYNRQITLDQMAKIAYMSPTYFSKKFKSVTGFGFREYLNHIRIKMATDMLMETQYSITEIASFCGYHDSNYFGDVFKRIVGSSPYKYRKDHYVK